MSEELSVTVSEHEVLPIPAHTHSDEDGRRGGCEIISTAQELLAAEGKAEVEEVSMFLDELKVCERGGRCGGVLFGHRTNVRLKM